MPRKNKRSPKPRLVHAEAMTASLGEVLAAEHSDEANDLLLLKETLPVGEVVEAAKEAIVDEAHEVGEVREAAKDVVANDVVAKDVVAKDEDVPATATLAGAGGEVAPEAVAEAALPLWRRLSPFRVAHAGYTAVVELRDGVKKAVQDVKDAAVRARSALVL